MVLVTRFFKCAAASVLFAAVLNVGAARADDEFPFGLEMTLDVARQPGSKRLPTLEIGDAGEAILELWCKGGKGRFSVAGNSVVFIPGPLQRLTRMPWTLEAPTIFRAFWICAAIVWSTCNAKFGATPRRMRKRSAK